MPRSSAKRSYRRRVRSSKCRGLRLRTCGKTQGCKTSSGKKRSFCRKAKNTRRRRRRQSGGMELAGASIGNDPGYNSKGWWYKTVHDGHGNNAYKTD